VESDKIEGSPPEKKMKVKVIDPVKGDVVDEYVRGGEDPEIKKGKSLDIFLCIYDPEWTYNKVDRENLKKKVKEYGAKYSELDKSVATEESILERAKKFQLDKFEVVKLVLYYTGVQAPSYRNDFGPQNTKTIFNNIVKMKKFSMVVFVADCCWDDSKINKDVSSELYNWEEITKVSPFDFQGNMYIVTCQSGKYSHGDKDHGSYFVDCFCKLWNGHWGQLLADSNRRLGNFQIATGLGNLVKAVNRDFRPKKTVLKFL